MVPGARSPRRESHLVRPAGDARRRFRGVAWRPSGSGTPAIATTARRATRSSFSAPPSRRPALAGPPSSSGPRGRPVEAGVARYCRGPAGRPLGIARRGAAARAFADRSRPSRPRRSSSRIAAGPPSNPCTRSRRCFRLGSFASGRLRLRSDPHAAGAADRPRQGIAAFGSPTATSPTDATFSAGPTRRSTSLVP